MDQIGCIAIAAKVQDQDEVAPIRNSNEVVMRSYLVDII